MMNYTTLGEVKEYLRLDDITEVTDDGLLLRFIRWSTSFINTYKDRRYDFRRETLLFDAPKPRGYISYAATVDNFNQPVTPRELFLEEYLTKVFAITNGDGVEVASEDYILAPKNKYPKTWLEMIGDDYWKYDSNGNRLQVISIDGNWGDADPNLSWVNSGDTLQADINETATTLSLSDVDGTNSILISPRFEAGMSIKVDDEFMFVTSVDNDLNTATVVRGHNGSVATAHLSAATVYTFAAPYSIAQACVRLTVWRYREKDADTFDKVYNIGDQSVSIPTSMPSDVREALGMKGRATLSL